MDVDVDLSPTSRSGPTLRPRLIVKFNAVSISPNTSPLKPVRPLYRRGSRDFAGLYGRHGWPSISPERLLRAQLLQAFYTVRSEREQLDYNLRHCGQVLCHRDEPAAGAWAPVGAIAGKKAQRGSL